MLQDKAHFAERLLAHLRLLAIPEQTVSSELSQSPPDPLPLCLMLDLGARGRPRGPLQEMHTAQQKGVFLTDRLLQGAFTTPLGLALAND